MERGGEVAFPTYLWNVIKGLFYIMDFYNVDTLIITQVSWQI